MNLPAASSGASCKCYRIDRVRSVRKVLTVGFTAMNYKCYTIVTAPRVWVLNLTVNKPTNRRKR